MSVWKRTEIISLLMATVVLSFMTFSAWRDWKASHASGVSDQETRVVLAGINALVSSLKDAEIGQRGYLLTRDLKYLAPYNTAMALVPGESDRLKKLLPAGEERDRLFLLVARKTSELGQTLDLERRVSQAAALALVTTDRGREDMQAIRKLADRFSTAGYAKLADSSTASAERTNRAIATDIGGGAILLTLLVFSAVTIQSSAERRDQLIGLLKQDDVRLRELGQKAQDAEAGVRAILESIADGFISLDAKFCITYLNNAGEQILACSKDDVMGKGLQTQFPDDITPEVLVRFREVVSSQTPLTFETFSVKRNAWWEQSVYPAIDQGLTVYFRDVTERKKLEERGRHTHKLESLGVLAGGVAHDFNNLLTAILGGASLVQDELPPDSTGAAALKIVLSASEQAARLTRQMLDYSGRGRFVIEQVDLSKEVRAIATLLQTSVTRNVQLVLNLETEGIMIEADAGQIQHLVMNLVINGAEAIENEPGTVAVSTRLQQLEADFVRDNMAGDHIVPGQYILLEVHDTGKGMDAQTVSRIFDPFFTTKFTGRGLGLAAALGIVRGHRGAIKVYSNPGQGTTFKVFFPVAASQVLTPVADPPPATLHGNETILIVDDEETVQRMASAALTKYGYKVLQARNGVEAIAIFEQDPMAVALVLLDMTMPVMSGEETLKRLKSVRADVLVIASSGYNEVEALRRFGQGVRGFLQKPYRSSQLAEKIRTAVTARNSEVI